MKKLFKAKSVKTFRHILLTDILVKLLGVVAVLPYKLSLFIGGVIGVWAAHLIPAYRDLADKNISGAFPGMSPLEVKRIRIAAFRNAGMNLVEFALFPFRPRSFWLKRVEIEGESTLREYTGRKGVIYLTAHTGNWELMGAFLAMIGFRINVVAKEIRDPLLNRILVGIRSFRGVNTIYRDGRSNTKRMISSLKRREVLGILIDQDTKVGGRFADFFGRPAYTPTACSQFARLKDTVVIPGFIFRKKDLKHKVVIMDPVEGGRDSGKETEKYNKIIEGFIREHPADWVWMHRRWKRSPA